MVTEAAAVMTIRPPTSDPAQVLASYPQDSVFRSQRASLPWGRREDLMEDSPRWTLGCSRRQPQNDQCSPAISKTLAAKAVNTL